jgi:hypothetical protein
MRSVKERVLNKPEQPRKGAGAANRRRREREIMWRSIKTEPNQVECLKNKERFCCGRTRRDACVRLEKKRGWERERERRSR